MSYSVRPHRRQPTRLPRPWDFLGKKSGVGCHFLLQCMKMKSESEVAQSCPTLSDPMDCSLPGSSVHGIFQARILERGAIAFSGGHVMEYLKCRLRNCSALALVCPVELYSLMECESSLQSLECSQQDQGMQLPKSTQEEHPITVSSFINSIV